MIELYQGDCLEVMRDMPDNSIDSIVTDPPYGLSFMGKKWDYQVPGVEIWKEALRVLKPGGYLLSFAGTRTQHRMAVNIEDAGFEIRDMIGWIYGSGFPKSLDISKAIDKAAGIEREIISEGKSVKRMIPGADQNETGSWIKDNGREFTPTETKPATDEAKKHEGYGTALKPALEPITVARKPLSEKTVAANVLKWGTGGINIDGCRVELNGENQPSGSGKNDSFRKMEGRADKFENETKITSNKGRFPSNLIHDGSEEVLELFPETKSGGQCTAPNDNAFFKGILGHNKKGIKKDSGSASRFFYCAKASKYDRGHGNKHPTVKPVDLMRYLIRLVTPIGGTTLDPFLGSGSSGVAAIQEGFDFVGIELEQESFELAEKRINEANNQLSF